MPSLEKRTMLEAFKQKKAPTMFLSGFFRTPPRNITRGKTVVIDVKRNDESIAVDIVRGTNGRMNENKRFSTKEYEPPVYDEWSPFAEDELMSRAPGQTEYADPEWTAEFIARVTDDQAINQEKILRSIEKQAADAFFTGTVILINNDTVDFKQKATHNFTTAVDWDAAGGLPLDDIGAAIVLNRKDGKVESDITLMGDQAFLDFLSNAQVEKFANFRRVDRVDIRPPVMNTEGAAFHGTFSVGSHTMQLWTYPQYYLVPVGFGLANEGTLVPYVPTDKVLVLSSTARYDLVYAGIPQLVNRVDPQLTSLGITSVPSMVATDFNPYAVVDDTAVSIKTGVRSAPLCIPTQIDSYTVIDTKI
ncbi:MAG: major capsid protein [Planctomycetes bacterium]|nr:major capsid protein [Planctomycetota bacterium]